MSLSRREFVRSVGWGGTGMLTLPFIISRGREELSARGIEGQNPPLIEPGFIRISGNENPRGPGDAALRALEGRVSYKVGPLSGQSARAGRDDRRALRRQI